MNRTVPLDGTYYLTADGTAERPIVIKAAGDGEVIFDGAGNFALSSKAVAASGEDVAGANTRSG